ncbi:MAG: SDR family oxidoreductase [Cytophagaceae bacterium]|jgi:short-subunit dehydrogenase|nr:SDR family oxidoreductase [Cytophagaceae bacterium]
MKGKVVIITGASSGIGLACAREFARKGAILSLAARNIEALETVVKELIPQGCKVIATQTDVSNPSECLHLVRTTVKTFGKIDILINNAGLSMRALFKDVELDVLKKLMDVNFWGTVYCTKFAFPYLMSSKGSVVGISSVAGYVGLPARTGYSASKFAMNGFLETLRTENLKTGLHVLVAAPGFTASNIRKAALTANGTPQGETPRKEERMMSAERVAQHIIRAVEKRKSKIILTFGEGKFTVFVNKWFPSLVRCISYRKMRREPNSPLK